MLDLSHCIVISPFVCPIISLYADYFWDKLASNHKINMLSGLLILKTFTLTLLVAVCHLYSETGHNIQNGSHVGRHLEFPKELKEDNKNF